MSWLLDKRLARLKFTKAMEFSLVTSGACSPRNHYQQIVLVFHGTERTNSMNLIHGKVVVLDFKFGRSPMPSVGLEIKLMLKFTSDTVIAYKMRRMIREKYNWDYEGEPSGNANCECAEELEDPVEDQL